jgi:sulfoxide reductase heme-binding subunit YedZ
MSTVVAPPQTKVSANRHLPYWQRRVARHLIIAAATFACTALFWQLFSVRRDLISHLSIATAYPALFLTAAAVLLGPWNVLRRRANPVSFDLRRDLGIWAGIMAVLHSAIGLNVHLRGRPWLYFVNEHQHIRHDLFGFGNDTGLLAALLFLFLLAISNDLSLRRLGTRKWKSMQRWTYVAIVLTVLHAVAYQHIEKRQAQYEAMLWSATTAITALQLAGWWRTRTETKSHNSNRVRFPAAEEQ